MYKPEEISQSLSQSFELGSGTRQELLGSTAAEVSRRKPQPISPHRSLDRTRQELQQPPIERQGNINDRHTRPVSPTDAPSRQNVEPGSRPDMSLEEDFIIVQHETGQKRRLRGQGGRTKTPEPLEVIHQHIIPRASAESSVEYKDASEGTLRNNGGK